jgi:methionine aminopeptidase
MEPTDEQKQSEKVTAPGVMEKYQAAGKICQQVMAEVLKECVDGASVYQLCTKGDKLIEDLVAGTYKGKKTEEIDGEQKQVNMEKGIAYPTAISVNEICGHYSPCKTDDVKLKEGDLIKINMGCHFDGYMSQLGHSIIVPGADKKKPQVKDRRADVM